MLKADVHVSLSTCVSKNESKQLSKTCQRLCCDVNADNALTDSLAVSLTSNIAAACTALYQLHCAADSLELQLLT